VARDYGRFGARLARAFAKAFTGLWRRGVPADAAEPERYPWDEGLPQGMDVPGLPADPGYPGAYILSGASSSQPDGAEKAFRLSSIDAGKWEAELLGALDVKKRKRPSPSERIVSPLATAAALLSTGGSRLPGVHARAGAIPGALAERDAARRDDEALRGWQDEQDAADQMLRVAPQLIGMALDRDAVTARIEADLKKAEIAQLSKSAIAQMRLDADFGKKILELDGKGQLSPASLASILVLTRRAAPEHAVGLAEAMITDLETSPNAWYGLQLAKQELGEAKLEQGRVEEDQRIVESLGAPFSSRLAAVGRLQQRGLLPAGDAVAIANELSQKAEESQARVALAEATEKYREELTKLLPEESAARVARSYGQIEHWRRTEDLAAARLDFQMADAARDGLARAYGHALDSLGTEINSSTRDIVSIRDKRKGWESTLAKLGEERGKLERDKKGNLKPGAQERLRDIERRERDARARIEAYSATLEEAKARKSRLLGESARIRSQMESDAVDLLRGSEEGTEEGVAQPSVQLGAGGQSGRLEGPIGGPRRQGAGRAGSQKAGSKASKYRRDPKTGEWGYR